ncbi:hypothetical protein SAMN05444344_2185 [Tenacibaculum mesophilum]|uniref:Uncharacterized protein n=1 Tax=Tenacibaculum mesophilum TaxID=104268 RepID=A0ABN5T5D0_9FLAO|nr:hypothetical protein [Tenacibaculum mesophilum]AZJ31414.1 hypothetical protein D6200_02030 [Tenacibaculum mesophilum]QFS29461.1 hypothetical protein F9Y86_14025 [Tenacibaculum mesophilum]SHF96281.1 hypothetical protein SAMN05444344_2185 [Tenacibaculum mesophilum]
MKIAAKFFDIISILFGIILVLWFTQIDYSNLSFENNISPYLGIFTALLFIFVMQFAKRNQKNKR